MLHDALRQMIVTAALPPGTPLNERELCDRFDVSRTPLREAILRLAEHGLVDVAPQHGTFVSEISDRAVRLGHFLRISLELPVIRQLAMTKAPDLSAARAAILEQKLAETRHDYPAFILADDAFHQALFIAADLPEIWDVVHAKKAHLDRSRFQSGMLRGELSRPITQHEAILAAITDRTPDHAETLARQHIDSGLTALDLRIPIRDIAT